MFFKKFSKNKKQSVVLHINTIADRKLCDEHNCRHSCGLFIGPELLMCLFCFSPLVYFLKKKEKRNVPEANDTMNVSLASQRPNQMILSRATYATPHIPKIPPHLRCGRSNGLRVHNPANGYCSERLMHVWLMIQLPVSFDSRVNWTRSVCNAE